MDSTINIALIAKVKQGDIHLALKKRGWSVAQAARELKISVDKIYRMYRMTDVPVLTIEEEVRFVEFTGKTMDQMFPKEFKAKEFLGGKREFEALRRCHPKELLGSGVQCLPVPLGEKDEVMLGVALNALQKLTSREREVINLLVVEGVDREEAAKVMNVTEERIRQINIRARKKLREIGDRARQTLSL